MSEKTDVYETEDVIDRWIGVLPDGTEYYGGDTLEALYQYEIDHREGLTGAKEWLTEIGGDGSKITIPAPFTEIIHRVMRTTTVRTTVTTEDKQLREHPHV